MNHTYIFICFNIRVSGFCATEASWFDIENVGDMIDSDRIVPGGPPFLGYASLNGIKHDKGPTRDGSRFK